MRDPDWRGITLWVAGNLSGMAAVKGWAWLLVPTMAIAITLCWRQR